MQFRIRLILATIGLATLIFSALFVAQNASPKVDCGKSGYINGKYYDCPNVQIPAGF